ncbi:MAG: STAS-like domain-containing protein [Desulfomonilia bacterium]
MSRLILDFRKVKAIGQGFVDEVFHTTPKENPRTVVRPVNENHAIAQMIRYVVDK